MKKINLLGITLLATTLLIMSNNGCYAKDISETDVKKAELEARKKTIESKQLQAKAIELNLELSKMDKKIITLAKEIQKNETNLSELENSLKTLEDNLKVKEVKFTEENNSLVQTLASLQNMSLNPSESIILQPHSPVDIIRSAILLREIVPYVEKKSSGLKVDLDELYSQKQKILNLVEKTQKQKILLEKQQTEMRVLQKKKTALRKEFETKGAETKKIAEQLSSKAKDLRELFDEIEKQKEIARKKKEEERRLAEIKRLQEMKKLGESKGVDLKTHEEIKKQTTQFASAKGSLLKPVSGQLVTSYGQATSNGVTSKGITYKTRANAQVIAPHDGTVVFSGPFKGYGNIIIVEHGEGYISLLAGLGNIDCELGQNILSGEPIGTMPMSNNAKLYVEIRKDRQPINPAPWFTS